MLKRSASSGRDVSGGGVTYGTTRWPRGSSHFVHMTCDYRATEVFW